MLHALWLFSQRGYDAVSIRDICGVVGIKESTVYYHFKNKQDIMDTLKTYFLSTATSMKKRQEQMIAGVGKFTEQELVRTTDFYLDQYLMEPFVNQFCRVLMIEQFSNASMRELYHQWFFDFPLHFHAQVFDVMIDSGVLKNMDRQYLSACFYTPIFFFYQKHLCHGNMSEENKDKFYEDVHRQLNEFIHTFQAKTDSDRLALVQ